MGWRTALTVVRGASVDDLARAGYTPDGGTSTPDEAIAEGLGDHLSVVAHGDDLVLIGRGTDPDLAATLHAALGVEVAHAFFMSTVDYYTWRVAHAGGTRTWSCGEGEVVVDEGEPLPEEGSLRVLDERGLRRLLEARTGLVLADLATGTAQSLSFAAPAPEKRRRRWFGRG